MVLHTINPSTRETEASWFCGLQASLIYKSTERNLVSSNFFKSYFKTSMIFFHLISLITRRKWRRWRKSKTKRNTFEFPAQRFVTWQGDGGKEGVDFGVGVRKATNQEHQIWDLSSIEKRYTERKKKSYLLSLDSGSREDQMRLIGLHGTLWSCFKRQEFWETNIQCLAKGIINYYARLFGMP